MNIRQAQAALFILDREVPLGDHRIDEDLLLFGLRRVGREVEHEEPERKSNLVGCQTDPLRGVQQLEHRSHDFLQAVVDLGHRARNVAKHGMWIIDDSEHVEHPRESLLESPIMVS